MISSEVYEEVYEVLFYMDINIISQIPFQIIKKIDEKRNKNYKTKIEKSDLFNLNNLSKEAVDMLLWIDVNYCKSIQEKENLKKKYYEKNVKSADEIFLNSKDKNEKEILKEEKLELEVVEENFIKKIIDKIKYIIKRR